MVYFRRPNFYYSKRHKVQPQEIKISLELLDEDQIRNNLIVLSQNLFSGKQTREDIYFWRHLNPENIDWERLQTEGHTSTYDKYHHGRKSAASLMVKGLIPKRYLEI